MNDSSGISNILIRRKGKLRMVTSQGRQPPAGFWSPIMGSNPNKMVEVGAGETLVLADVQGAGQITRIWMTTMVLPGSRYNAHHYGVVRLYWDGEETPSVEAPFGAFFGVPWGEYKHYIAEPLSCTSGGYNCQFPMPYERGFFSRWNIWNRLRRRHPCASTPNGAGKIPPGSTSLIVFWMPRVKDTLQGCTCLCRMPPIGCDRGR